MIIRPKKPVFVLEQEKKNIWKGRICGQRSLSLSSDWSAIEELMRSNEFRNSIVSQITFSLEVTCISTDNLGLFEKQNLLLWLNTSWRLSVICSVIISVANVDLKWLVPVASYVSLSRCLTVDIVQIDWHFIDEICIKSRFVPHKEQTPSLL
jgi:hypothetical protein